MESIIPTLNTIIVMQSADKTPFPHLAYRCFSGRNTEPADWSGVFLIISDTAPPPCSQTFAASLKYDAMTDGEHLLSSKSVELCAESDS